MRFRSDVGISKRSPLIDLRQNTDKTSGQKQSQSTVSARSVSLWKFYLDSLLEKSRADATGTRLDSLHCPCFTVYTPNLLKIGIPYLRTLIVRMADFMTHHRFFSAYLTNSRHKQTPL